jgi:hypothetical protein
MYTDLWVIEWREGGRGDGILEIASTPQQAVETIRRLLDGETAFDESVEDTGNAFDILFCGVEPTEILLSLDDQLELECDNGVLSVRRTAVSDGHGGRQLAQTIDADHRPSPMHEELTPKLKTDFLEWSGGTPPESDHQITVYIDYAAQQNADPVEMRRSLRAWMNDDTAP